MAKKEKLKKQPREGIPALSGEVLTVQELKLLVNIISKATTTVEQANIFIVLANKCSRMAQVLELPKPKTK